MQSRKSKKTRHTRAKPAAAYCMGGRGSYKAAARYGSRGSAHKKKKTGGVACLCAMQCPKKHKHNKKTCAPSVVCLCTHVGPHKHASGKMSGGAATSRKMSAAYRQAKQMGQGTLAGSRKTRIPKLRSGTLRNHGYSSKLPPQERHAALRRAVAEVGPTVVIRKLNVVATLNSAKPDMARTFKADSHWVKREFGTTAHPKM